MQLICLYEEVFRAAELCIFNKRFKFNPNTTNALKWILKAYCSVKYILQCTTNGTEKAFIWKSTFIHLYLHCNVFLKWNTCIKTCLRRLSFNCRKNDLWMLTMVASVQIASKTRKNRTWKENSKRKLFCNSHTINKINAFNAFR